MNYCNRRLLLPLEDNGLTVDDIILTHLIPESYEDSDIDIINPENK